MDESASMMAREMGRRTALRTREVWDTLLKDYQRARFRRVYPHFMKSARPPFWFLCGEINETNGLGGYVGWKRFAVGYADRGIAIGTEDGGGTMSVGSNLEFFIALCGASAPQSQTFDNDFASEMTAER